MQIRWRAQGTGEDEYHTEWIFAHGDSPREMGLTQPQQKARRVTGLWWMCITMHFHFSNCTNPTWIMTRGRILE